MSDEPDVVARRLEVLRLAYHRALTRAEQRVLRRDAGTQPGPALHIGSDGSYTVTLPGEPPEHYRVGR